MRVCLVAYRFYDDNAHMMQFANALARRGDYVEVLSLRRQGLSKYEVIEGVHVHRLQTRTVNEKIPMAHLVKTLMFFLRAAGILTLRHLRKRYDVIHIQSVPDFLVFAAILPKALGAKIILDFRDLVPELYAAKFGLKHDSFTFRLLLKIEKASASVADHVIVANPVWYGRVASRSSELAKCTMFWYYPDPAVFFPRPNRRSGDKFVITYPGTLNWHQGVDIAVRAFPKILERAPNAEFHIYGEGPAKNRLKELVREFGLSEKVKIFDPLPLAKVVEVMAASDLGLVPKRVSTGFGDEAASTKISEFMALGVPVVASRTKVEQCFFDDSIVRYFKSEDEADLVEAVVAVCLQPELRRQLIDNGFKYIEKTSWDTEMAKYRSLVDSLVNPEHHGPRLSDGSQNAESQETQKIRT